LRQEVAAYLNERFGLTYDPQTEILITVGVSQGLDIAMRTLLNPATR
jgi:aminotransferase